MLLPALVETTNRPLALSKWSVFYYIYPVPISIRTLNILDTFGNWKRRTKDDFTPRDYLACRCISTILEISFSSPDWLWSLISVCWWYHCLCQWISFLILSQPLIGTLRKGIKMNLESIPGKQRYWFHGYTKAKTNPNYGKLPKERDIHELLTNGFINLDKPSGPTSHQVDAWIKEIFEIDKVGHHGTLDPHATGVLPIGIGDATKALQALLSAGKEYVALMKLHKDIPKDKIINICNNLVGEVSQIPPVRSAVKRVKRK